MATEKFKISMLRFYASKDWPIFPITWLIDGHCSCGDSRCNSPGKHPLVKNGLYSATKDLNLITQWHERWPEANWGIRTGDKKNNGAGIVVIDIDNKTDGFTTWDLLREEYPDPIETVTVSTGNGGQHLWFIYPEGTEIKSGTGVLGKGIDIRSNSGYVLVPPSSTTYPYKFELNPRETALLEMPAWLRSKLNGNIKPLIINHMRYLTGFGKLVLQGARHQSLTSIAGSLKKAGLGENEIRSTIEVIRDKRFDRGDHQVTDEEIEGVVQWIKNK